MSVNSMSKGLRTIANGMVTILDTRISKDSYCPIDLSIRNIELNNYNIQNPTQCQDYITTILKKNDAKVAFGGYLEKRDLYSNKSSFSLEGEPRNIHLGIDFWTKAETKVIAPLNGTVHSFQNNNANGDYGPTIILKHDFPNFTFHTLYGHLSVESLENLYEGKSFVKGETLATLGATDINVNYAPHLHFQIIIDMEGKKGDYPGVCSSTSLDFYSKNCPDPSYLLRFEL